MQVHIALDEQTVENGGLHFIPGSHRYSVDAISYIQTIIVEEKKTFAI